MMKNNKINIIKYIDLNKIIIQEDFEKHPPKKHKVQCKIKKLNDYRIIPFVILNNKNELLDGYIWYLYYKKQQRNKIYCIYQYDINKNTKDNIINNINNFCNQNGYEFKNIGYGIKIIKNIQECFYIFDEDINKIIEDKNNRIFLYHENYKKNDGILIKKYEQTPIHKQCKKNLNDTLKYIKKHKTKEMKYIK